MKILIVAATEKEVETLLRQLTLETEISSGLKKYAHKKLSLDVLITGVGMVATTYQLTKTLAAGKYDLALNFGIAGSFDKKLQIGSVVNVTKDLFSELGAENENDFLSLIDLNLVKETEFPFVKGELVNTSGIKNPVITRLQKTKGITVNKVHGNEISIQKTSKQFSPDTESMEGAAFLYVCMLEKTPCTQIRAISNYVEKRDKEKWNISLAIKNLNQTALEILNAF